MLMCQGMGMSWRTTAAADLKPHARQFIKFNHDKVEHIFDNNLAMIHDDLLQHAKCDVCSAKGRPCDYKHGNDPVDLLTAGLPCQPFTKLRQHNGDTENTGDAAGHTKFSVVFEDFSQYLEGRKPRGWIVEEVPDFAKPSKAGPAYLEDFTRRAELLGYSIKAVMLHAEDWVGLPRKRTRMG
jgi:site-specific DNA-cytosine methylase